MTDENGNGSNGKGLAETNSGNGNERDPSTGHFRKGWKGGPGRRAGTQGLPALIRRECKRRKLPVREVAWEMFEVLLDAARGGDVTAAKIALDRLLGTVTPPPEINVNVQNAIGQLGPPTLTTDEARTEYRKRVAQIFLETGVLGDE